MKKKFIILILFVLALFALIPVATATCSSHNWMTESYVAPTCGKAGKSVKRCIKCGESKTNIINATGLHKYSGPTCTASKQCSVCKKIDREALGHNWMTESYTAPTCTTKGKTVLRCIRCGASKTSEKPMVDHAYSKATCTQPPTCSCGAKKKGEKALGHSTGDWLPDRPASCTATGTEKKVCSRCKKAIEYRPVRELGHDLLFNPDPDKTKPVCTHGVQYEAKCMRPDCNYTEVIIHDINPNNHGGGRYVCKIPAKCSSEGLDVWVCDFCHREDKSKELVKPALGHNYQDDPDQKSYKCFETAVKTQTCSRDSLGLCNKPHRNVIIRSPKDCVPDDPREDTLENGHPVEYILCKECGYSMEINPIHTFVPEYKFDCEKGGNIACACEYYDVCFEKQTIYFAPRPHKLGPEVVGPSNAIGKYCINCDLFVEDIMLD